MNNVWLLVQYLADGPHNGSGSVESSEIRRCTDSNQKELVEELTDENVIVTPLRIEGDESAVLYVED